MSEFSFHSKGYLRNDAYRNLGPVFLGSASTSYLWRWRGGAGRNGRPRGALPAFQGTSTRNNRIVERRDLSIGILEVDDDLSWHATIRCITQPAGTCGRAKDGNGANMCAPMSNLRKSLIKERN